jgi:hypothetical protein
MQSKTKVMLKALRANLKLAIDHGAEVSIWILVPGV